MDPGTYALFSMRYAAIFIGVTRAGILETRSSQLGLSARTLQAS